MFDLIAIEDFAITLVESTKNNSIRAACLPQLSYDPTTGSVLRSYFITEKGETTSPIIHRGIDDNKKNRFV